MKISRDVNGNKVLKVEKSDTVNGTRGFSVQTNGKLPITHQKGLNDFTVIELKLYIKKYGTTKQKEKMDTLITRKEYMMDSNILHHDYYLQFVTDATYSFVKNKIGLDKLKKSTCPNLNDVIKMEGSDGWLWDMSPINLDLARKAGESGSLSNFTCVGKAAAKELLK